jgi:hypothetical protein
MYHEFLMPYVKLMSIVNKHLGKITITYLCIVRIIIQMQIHLELIKKMSSK